MLPRAEFCKNAGTRDGLNTWCRACAATAYRKWRLANLGKRREAASRARLANPEAYRETARRHYLAHTEETRARVVAWRAANPEAIAASRRRSNHLRRAKVKDTDITPKIDTQMREERTMCPLCRKKMTNAPGPTQKNLDHIIPLGVGGTHTTVNVRIICRTCNLKRPKNGIDLGEYQPALWAVAV